MSQFDIKQLPSLAAAKIWVGNASGLAAPVSLSGDVTINNVGVTAISLAITPVWTGLHTFNAGYVLPASSGTNRSLKIANINLGLDNYGGISVYPSSGSNVAAAVAIVPKGTGFSSTNRAQLSIFNTDYVADSANSEYLIFRAAGTLFAIANGSAGTGSLRPIMLACGWASDGITNANQILLNSDGSVTIGAGRLGIGVSAAASGSWLQIKAGTTAAGQINFAASIAPASPVNGDVWFEGGTAIKIRIGGVTKTFTLT